VSPPLPLDLRRDVLDRLFHVAIATVAVLLVASLVVAALGVPFGGADTWRPTRLGTAPSVALLLAALVAVQRHRHGTARLLAATAATSNLATLALHAVQDVGERRGTALLTLPGWVSSEQAAAALLALSIVVLAATLHGRRIEAVRRGAAVIAALLPSVALTTIAHGAEGVTVLPRVEPMGGVTALSLLLLTIAYVAATPDRWPLAAFHDRPTDRLLLFRLLPVVLVVPLLPPAVVAFARVAGARPELTSLLAALAPTILLLLIVSTTVRAHHVHGHELQQHHDHLARTLDALQEAVYVRDGRGRLLYCNEAGRHLNDELGLTTADIEVVTPELASAWRLIDTTGRPVRGDRLPLFRTLSDGRPHRDLLGQASSRGLRWFEVRAVPVPLEDGSKGVAVTYTDVTDLERTRRGLLESERTLRAAVEHSPIGIAIVAPDGRFLDVNASLCELLGRSPAQLLAGGFQAITHPDDLMADLDLLAECLEGRRERYVMRKRYLHADGTWVEAELTVALVRDERALPSHFVSQIVVVPAADAAARSQRPPTDVAAPVAGHRAPLKLVVDGGHAPG
jgi:PAS domain S-box-containing protein